MTALADGDIGVAPPAVRYGVWTGYRMTDDRSSWHPAVRQFYEYWRSVAPPGRLPGRQHIRPEDIVPLLPLVFILDVFRDPFRLRYRLAGTDVVRSVQCELTGRWVDEVQPETLTRPALLDRYRFIAETGQPTWRRGPTLWSRDPQALPDRELPGAARRGRCGRRQNIRGDPRVHQGGQGGLSVSPGQGRRRA